MRAMAVTAFGGPETLHELALPVPVPNYDEAMIDVAHAGVGFVDLLFQRGAFVQMMPLPLMPLPFVPGIEVSGRVRAPCEARHIMEGSQ